MVSYQFGYAVQDKLGHYTIVLFIFSYYHGQYYKAFASFLCCKFFITCFLCGALTAFQLKLQKKMNFCIWQAAQTCPKNNEQISLYLYYPAFGKVTKPVFLKKSANFNSQFEQQYLLV